MGEPQHSEGTVRKIFKSNAGKTSKLKSLETEKNKGTVRKVVFSLKIKNRKTHEC